LTIEVHMAVNLKTGTKERAAASGGKAKREEEETGKCPAIGPPRLGDISKSSKTHS